MTLEVDFGVFTPIDLGDRAKDEPKWNVICKTVTSKSHAAGDFEITEAMLHSAVNNFKLRSTKKIPIKFEHHDSNHPNFNPNVGSPAQGHVLDMKVQGTGDNAELLGLTKFLEPAKTYVLDEKYEWFSPGLLLDSLDRKTGKRVGMRIREVSLVTDPHLYDMPSVRLSNDEREIENTLTVATETDTTKEDAMSKELEDKIAKLENQLREKDLEVRSANAKITELGLEHKSALGELQVSLANKTREYDDLVKASCEGDVDLAMSTYGKTHNLSEDMRPDLLAVRLSNPKLFAKLYPQKSAPTAAPAKAPITRPAYLTSNLSNDPRTDIRSEGERRLSQSELHEKYMKEGMDNTAAALRAAKETRLWLL